MRKYIVAVYRNTHEFPIPRVDRRAMGIAWGINQEKRGHMEDLQNDVYFTDTLEDAQQLANSMASANMNNQVLIAETKEVFHIAPGQLSRSRITDKGLLPF